jgi:hypothetical protein
MGASSSQALQDETKIYLLRMPGKGWALTIPKWAFTEGWHRVEGDTPSFTWVRDPDKEPKLSPVMLKIRMEPAKTPGDAQALGNFAKKNFRKSSLVVQDSLKQTVYNNIPVNRYSYPIDIPRYPQGEIFPRGKILEAYYVKDDTWITVRLDFLKFRKEDEKFFYGVLDNLQIVDIAK